jgi:hypothetical protein
LRLSSKKDVSLKELARVATSYSTAEAPSVISFAMSLACTKVSFSGCNRPWFYIAVHGEMGEHLDDGS